MNASSVSGSGQLAGKNLLLDAGQNIGIAGDTDLITLKSNSFVVAGAVSGSGALSATGAITGAGGLALQGSGITAAGAIAGASTIVASAAITAGTSFVIGSADLNEADMEKLDGITDGTGAANKALVLDGSRDIDTINALGIASMANNWTNASRTVADMGVVTTMDLNGGSIDGTVIGAASAAAGTFAAVVATSGDFSDGNIANVGDLDCDSVSVADAASGLTIDFSGGNTTKNEMLLKDNVGNALAIVQGANVYMQFDTTDGAEVIKYEKAMRMEDDIKLEFGTGADVSIEYDENGTDELRFAGNAVTFEQAVSFDGDMALGLTTADTVTVKGNSTFAGTTVADLGTVTTADINGGTLDGVTIGGATPAAGTFTAVVGTTISGSGNLSTNADLSVNGESTLYGTLTCKGNLIVSGSKIIHSTSHLLVNDPLIGLGYSEHATGSAGDRGILMGLAGENAPTMFWDESATQFGFVTTTSLPTDTAVVVAAYADLRVKDLTVNSIAGSVLQSINAIADEAGTLAAGFNYGSATLTAARAWTLPASPTVGQIVYVKAPSNCGDTNTITITRAGSQTIDGATTAVLQSPFAAVGLCYAAADVWKVF